ncbi:MAG: hypothetical protein CME85_10925 [Henriciella sp.]|nr:hypothetical protein [Henriciella sp.]MBK75992.1 hypothetical protein [Henriciella sp.]
MKRTLLTASAALALMAAPALAQAPTADVTAEPEADVTTNVPDVAIEGETGAEMDADTPTASTPSWDGDAELDTQTNIDDGVDSEFYENDDDTVTGSDLNTSTGVEVDTPAADIEAESETELDVESKSNMNEEYGQGGTYYENKEAAEADADLYSDEAETLKDEKDVQTELETETEGQYEEDGMGGPEAADRDDAAARYGDLNRVDNPDVDVKGLTEYEEEQIEKAGEDAAQDIDKLEKDSTQY